MRLHRVRVLERRSIGEHVLLCYEWSGTEPEPGQFVGARASDSMDPFLSRPFFVHDWEGEVVSLLFKVRGLGTGSLAAVEDHLLVSAPRGRGFDLGSPAGAALVGGGVWVSPLRFLSRRLRERGVAHDVYLEAPPGAPEGYLRWLEGTYPGARLVPTDGSAGGLVSALGKLSDYGSVYVSGNRETLRSVRRVRSNAQLAVRERMACMDGSCYGCAVPIRSEGGVLYRRACVEGPVFEAGDLAW